MSRRLALTATAVALSALAAAPTQAWPFGRKAAPAPAAQTPAPAAGQTTPAPAAPAPPRKATAEERAEADRLDPLVRAAFWQREVDVDPQEITAGLELSQALRGIGRNDEAATAAEHVLVLHPGNVAGLIELARSDIARNQGFYAIDPARRAAAAAPKDWRPQSLLGVAYDQVGRTADARAAWQQALILSPNNPAILSNLAMSWFSAGDMAKAEPLLRQAVAQPGVTLHQERQNLGAGARHGRPHARGRRDPAPGPAAGTGKREPSVAEGASRHRACARQTRPRRADVELAREREQRRGSEPLRPSGRRQPGEAAEPGTGRFSRHA